MQLTASFVDSLLQDTKNSEVLILLGKAYASVGFADKAARGEY